jgi:hypothetical protein
MIDELRIGKDLEGNYYGLIEVPFGDLPRGIEENHERTSVRIAGLKFESIAYRIHLTLPTR